MAEQRYRLITRSDFDGLVCAVLLRELDMIDDILFVQPKDMQDGRIAVSERDISTNLPYVEGIHLAFDHHHSEAVRATRQQGNHIIVPSAPSAARVVYEYYGAEKAFPRVSVEMMEAVDKADSAEFSRDEILRPSGWVLLNFLMDSRTGLGRFRDFRISNYQLMMDLIDYCRGHGIKEILDLADVRERVDLYLRHAPLAEEQLRKGCTLQGRCVVFDMRNIETIYATNRFLIYALYPEANISIHRMWGRDRQKIVFAIGKSILDRSSRINVGELCLKYGGGGHAAAGTCQVETAEEERIFTELIHHINQDG